MLEEVTRYLLCQHDLNISVSRWFSREASPKIELALFWSSGGGLLARNQSARGRGTGRHLRQRS